MDMSKWVKESLVAKFIYFLVSPGLYDGSWLTEKIRALGNTAAGYYGGSALRVFSLGRTWETSAIDNSRIASVVLRLRPVAERFIDRVNSLIRHSFIYILSEDLIDAFILLPFKTMSYVLLPWIIVSTGLKGVFSSFSPRGLAFRAAVTATLFIFNFVTVSMEGIISSSYFGRITEGLWGEKLIGGISRKNTDFFFSRKTIFFILGIVLGIFHYFLPSSTFIKLVGAVFFSFAVYIWPGWGMMAAAFALPIAATSYSVAVVGVTFISAVLNYRKYRPQVPGGLVPAIFFIIIAGLSVVFSFARADSIHSLPLYAGYFMIFYLAAVLYKDKKIIKVGLASQIISASIVALYGIYQYFFLKISTSMSWVDLSQFPELQTRVYSTLENPNVLAEYLVLVIPLVIAILWVSKGLCQKAAAAGAFGIMSVCLVLTFSRGAWVGMAAAILVFSLMKAPGLFIAAILLAMISPAFLPPVVVHRAASIGDLEDSSTAYRIPIWIAAARIIADYWFTGVGLGLAAFSKIYRDYMIAGTYALHTHNLFLQIAAEMGIFGVIAFIWLAGSGFSRGFYGVKGKSKSSFLTAGVIAALSGHLLHGSFEYIWYSPKVVLAFWMTLGTISGLSNLTSEPAAEVVS